MWPPWSTDILQPIFSSSPTAFGNISQECNKTAKEMVSMNTWKSKGSSAKFWWDRTRNPWIAAGITSLGDERAIPLPLIDFSGESLRSSLLTPILRSKVAADLHKRRECMITQSKKWLEFFIILLGLLVPENRRNHFPREIVCMLV